MAAKGAHITQNSEVKPSIFEVVAADSLNSTFYPALKRVANLLATVKPGVFGHLLRYYDEVYLVFNFVVQNYYLRYRGGSLSEVFYGLKRTSQRSNHFEPNGQRWSLFLLTVGPYIYSKLDQKFQKWKAEHENGLVVSPEKLMLAKLISYMNACFEAVKLMHYVSYLARIAPTHSPLLRIMKLTLTYQQDEEESWTLKALLAGQVKLVTMLSSILLRSLELSAFFLQFIEWWQNEANMGDLNKLPTPEAPRYDQNSEKYKNNCPLCLQRWEIPTAVSISGYVYCYRCIVASLQKESKCPVTKYPASISVLVRVFDDEND